MKNGMQPFVTPESVKKLSADLGISCVYHKDIAGIARSLLKKSVIVRNWQRQRPSGAKALLI